jgi:hypothetical protein
MTTAVPIRYLFLENQFCSFSMLDRGTTMTSGLGGGSGFTISGSHSTVDSLSRTASEALSTPLSMNSAALSVTRRKWPEMLVS